MSLERDFDALLRQNVTVTPFSTRGAYGSPTFSTGLITAHRARIVYTQHLVRDARGQQVVAGMKVFIGGTGSNTLPNLTPQDKLTLEDGTVPRLIAVSRYPDEDGVTHHVVAHCG